MVKLEKIQKNVKTLFTKRGFCIILNTVTITIIKTRTGSDDMKTMKYSRQRESIKEFLQGRTDHPTADTVYTNIREIYPNISLGTVYRNLALLASLGEIQKITCEDGADRFDPNTLPHYHVVCRCCGRVDDLPMVWANELDRKAEGFYGGKIDGHVTSFFGICADCLEQQANAEKSEKGA